MTDFVLGVDVGEARIGLALASNQARLPRPYSIISNDKNVFRKINQVAQAEESGTIVVGLPRNMRGEETAQTKLIREFAKRLASHTQAKVIFADESLSTRRAEDLRRKLKDRPIGAHLDDLAACFILEEFLNHGEI